MNTAWAAGFYEGEGSCGFYTKGKDRSGGFCISIGQNDPEMLYRLKSIFGFGYVKGPYRPKNKNSKPIWFYKAYKTGEFLTIMCALWPWLSQRRKEQFKKAVASWRKI